MAEFSRNLSTEKISRRERARILGVQSVCAAFSNDHFVERQIPDEAPEFDYPPDPPEAA